MTMNDAHSSRFKKTVDMTNEKSESGLVALSESESQFVCMSCSIGSLSLSVHLNGDLDGEEGSSE